MPIESSGVPHVPNQKRKAARSTFQADPFFAMTRAAVEADVEANVGNTADARRYLKRLALLVYDLGQITFADD